MSCRLYLVFALLLAFTSIALAIDNAESLMQQGYEQTKEGKLDEALATLQQAVQVEPDSSLAYTRLGGVQVLRQEYSAGVKSFQQAIMLDQKNSAAFVGMGMAYLHMGQHSLARQALIEAKKLDPSKKPELDKVLIWIDQRTSSDTGH